MTRVLSALVLVAIIGSVLWLGPWWAVLTLAVVVAALGAWEVAGLARAIDAPISGLVVSVAAGVVCTAMPIAMGTGDVMVAVLLVLLVGAGLVTLGSGPPAPAVITRAALTMMAPLYVGLPLGALVWIHVIHGPRAVIFLIATVAASDTLQYVTGRAFGRTKLAPRVSPAKTIEGALSGLAAAALVGGLLGPLWGGAASAIEGVGLGLVLGAIGIAGDLFESLLKRSAGVKDSSHLIPGHGGVLDRIDAYLFAVPVYFLYLRYVG